MTESADETSYEGLLGAFPYAFRRSNSLTFKAYTLIGTLLAVVLSIVFVLAVVALIGDTVDAAGSSGSVSLLRSFFILAGLLVLMPILAPILFVARRHRRDIGDDVEYDRRLATTGFVFLASMYVGLIISTPTDLQSDTDGVLGPTLETLYALPTAVAFVPPIVAIVLIVGTHRISR